MNPDSQKLFEDFSTTRYIQMQSYNHMKFPLQPVLVLMATLLSSILQSYTSMLRVISAALVVCTKSRSSQTQAGTGSMHSATLFSSRQTPTYQVCKTWSLVGCTCFFPLFFKMSITLVHLYTSLYLFMTDLMRQLGCGLSVPSSMLTAPRA